MRLEHSEWDGGKAELRLSQGHDQEFGLEPLSAGKSPVRPSSSLYIARPKGGGMEVFYAQCIFSLFVRSFPLYLLASHPDFLPKSLPAWI